MLSKYALTQIYLRRSHICRSLFLAILGCRKKGLRNTDLAYLSFVDKMSKNRNKTLPNKVKKSKYDNAEIYTIIVIKNEVLLFKQ